MPGKDAADTAIAAPGWAGSLPCGRYVHHELLLFHSLRTPPMLTRCLACSREFPRNVDLEWLPVGYRVGFDAHRGRLWIICGWCSHWSLVPLEHRWEAVEELSRLTCGSATVLGATDQVSLLAIGGVEVLRVGRAPAQEEAWWRYGKALRGRRRRYNAITRAGGSIAAGAAFTAAGGFAFLMPEIALLKWRSFRAAPGRARTSGVHAAESFERWFRYGRVAWRGSAPCQRCGHFLTQFLFSDGGTAQLRADRSVHIRCRRCRHSDGWHVLAGADAEEVVRRILAYENIAGADDTQLDAATQLIRAQQVILPPRLSLRQTPREMLIGLELLVTEQIEARTIRWDLADLEARWRTAEELAQIIDAELTPVQGLAPPAPGAGT